MDKKNTTIGILFLAAALGLMLFGGKLFHQNPPPAPEQPAAETAAAPATSPADAAIGSAPAEQPMPESAMPAATPASAGVGLVAAGASNLYTAVEDRDGGETPVRLANDYIEVRFTPMGGAIAEVALKKYPAERDGDDPYLLNARHAAPALSLLDFPGADRGARYELVSQTPTTVEWRATVPGRFEVTRTYSIHPSDGAGEPYLIKHQTTFRNLAGQPLATPALTFNLGMAEPANPKDLGTSLNVAACRGKDVEFRGRGDFAASGWFANMLGRTRAERAVVTLDTADVSWATVKNQFFASILIPAQPGGRVEAHRVLLDGTLTGPVGLTGNWITNPLTVASDQPTSVALDYYTGPKEFKRLNELDRNEYLIMQWGSFIGIFSAVLFRLLNFIHSLLAASGWAWGWSIILTTVLIRSLMWPITAQAARSAKRMAKIQGPLKEIQEKYKDNRVKQQEETIKLFREHKINPVGGCLPMVIQIPIFFGLFRMLQSASELRFADFLWIHDLSAADTVATIGGFPINPTPLLMGASMFLQMRMTPTPTTDNASAKMMKFMPFFVTFMCYNFSSGLAVYWTASNCFSIFQQWITNRRKDTVDTAPAPVRAGAAERAKPVRDAKVSNVSKKKK